MTLQKSTNAFNWDDIRYFLALVDCGTVSATAKRLAVNHVTVSRRIDRLENDLNRVLFNRSKDGYSITLEGSELFRQLRPISDAFEQIALDASHTAADRRIVKISTLHTLAESFVEPAIARLQSDHPDTKIEIDVSAKNVSIAKKEADIAIRLGLPEKGEFLSRRLGSIEYKLVGTPLLVEQLINKQDVPTITFGSNFSQLPEAQYIYSRFGIDSISLRSNSAAVQHQSAIKGVGIAVLPAHLLRNTQLVSIEMEEPLVREVWMLTRSNAIEIPAVSRVKEALVTYFREVTSSL